MFRRISDSFRCKSPNNKVKIRSVRSLSDAIEMYHRTGVFDMRENSGGSYDLVLSDGESVQGVNLDLPDISVRNRCEDLMVAAATQMHDKNARSRQVTNITPASAGGNGVAS